MATWLPEAAAQTILAQAEATPSVVMLGESSTYAVTFLNTTAAPNLNTPRVAGLEFSSQASTSTMQRVINGRITSEIKLSWNFRPTEIGSYSIPGRVILINGAEVPIPAVEVEAVPQSEEAKSRAFINLKLPDPPYYVGQALPTQLNLFIRSDLSVSNIEFPDLTGDTFIHSEFDNNPRRLRGTLNGRTYDVLSWDIVVTPIKSGPADLSFSQNIILQIPVSDGRFPSIFSMRQARNEPYALRSDKTEFEVLPLPEEGRPEDFSDAVGQFEVSMSLSDTSLQVGEPVTLTLSLEGDGNFNRIGPPKLPEWENWRFYPPKVSFENSDAEGFSGTKSFEYILIPQSEAIEEVPQWSYSTFDPATQSYQTTLLEAQPLTVEPSATPIDTDITLPSFNGQPTVETRIPESILPIRPSAGNLRPVQVRSWMSIPFVGANLVSATLLLALARWQQRRRRFLTDGHLARRHTGSRLVRKNLQAASVAASSGQADAFFKSARFCISECVSHLSPGTPDAQTLVSSDCVEILRDSEAPQELQDGTAEILNAADSFQFAGLVPDSGELKALQQKLTKVISDLNRLSK